MAVYKVYFKVSVEKDFKIIPRADLRKILDRIKILAHNPRPPGCEKLTDRDSYRIRQGQYRIIYAIQDDVLTVWVVKVSHRKDVYR